MLAFFDLLDTEKEKANLKEILINQKKSQNLSKVIIVLIFALIIIKLFVTG